MKKKQYDCPEAELVLLDMQCGVLDASPSGVYGDSLPSLNGDDTTLGWN